MAIMTSSQSRSHFDARHAASSRSRSSSLRKRTRPGFSGKAGTARTGLAKLRGAMRCRMAQVNTAESATV